MYSGDIPTLVETEWLAAHLQDSDLRILDCSVMMEITDKGDRKYSRGKARWEEGHIPGSVFVDFLCGDLGSTCNPAVPLMTPLADFAAAMESFGISDDSQVVLYDNSNHGWAARLLCDPHPPATWVQCPQYLRRYAVTHNSLTRP